MTLALHLTLCTSDENVCVEYLCRLQTELESYLPEDPDVRRFCPFSQGSAFPPFIEFGCVS